MSEQQFAVVGYPDSHNLGDEVQSIAAARLLPSVDLRIPREGMDSFRQPGRPPVKLLCNGFFMYQPSHWPPSEDIDPLFVSLHVSSEEGADKYMLQPELKKYYDRFAPIGCRDRGTAHGFQSIGVDAYFSGCVTLTLRNPYPPEERTDDIVLADPFYKFQDKDYRAFLRRRIIPAEHRHRVVEVTHDLPQDHAFSEEEKIEQAEALLARYAKASLVITSRIHVALPCLGFGTPVLFINTGYDRKPTNRERFDGLLELFHTVEGHHFPLASRKPLFKLARLLRLHRLRSVKPLDIDFNHPPANKQLHLPLAEALRKRVGEWVKAGSPA